MSSTMPLSVVCGMVDLGVVLARSNALKGVPVHRDRPVLLGLPALERFLATAMVELTAAEETLNSLNVYPVPDGDTGSNLRTTWAAFFPADADVASVGGADEEGAVRAALQRVTAGARGNVGVIMSEYVRGCAAALAYEDGSLMPLGADRLVEMLHSGARAARVAVEKPVEGTVLSVADAAAAGAARGRSQARRQDRPVTPADVLDAAVEDATEALRRSPQQLAMLADAGVVDSGGAGLLFVLEALARVAGARHGLPRSKSHHWLDVAAQHGFAVDKVCQVAQGGPAFELMAVAEGLDDGAALALRAALGECGDSVVVAGGDGVHRIHVHTDDVLGAASVVRAASNLRAPAVTRFDGPHSALSIIDVDVVDDVLAAYAKALGFGLGGVGSVQVKTRKATSQLIITDGVRDAAPTGVLLGGRSAVHAIATVEACAFEAVLDDEPDFVEVANDAAFLAVMQADSWGVARRLVRTRAREAEHLVVLVSPGAKVQDVAAFTQELGGMDAEATILRIEAGVLVQMGVE